MAYFIRFFGMAGMKKEIFRKRNKKILFFAAIPPFFSLPPKESKNEPPLAFKETGCYL